MKKEFWSKNCKWKFLAFIDDDAYRIRTGYKMQKKIDDLSSRNFILGLAFAKYDNLKTKIIDLSLDLYLGNAKLRYNQFKMKIYI